MVRHNCKKKKHVNQNSRSASLPISQSFIYKEVCRLILASSQKKLRRYMEFL